MNRTDTLLPLSFRISSDESALVTTGEDLSLTLSDGQERVLSAALRNLNGASSPTVKLAPLTPGESRVLRGALALEQSAGNDYQDLSGNLRISFEATSETPRLAETGATRDPAAVALALALAAGGVLLLTRRTPESTRR
ncbi:LPXTG cell wall anchor domain-containing protein [Leucobacter chromiireducens]|uniref:LPXTG cell wall anchor domain-containing protein n=1 Tax=Leucobacter chromiireducens TaxID=283877 RepID=UPI003F7DEB63